MPDPFASSTVAYPILIGLRSTDEFEAVSKLLASMRGGGDAAPPTPEDEDGDVLVAPTAPLVDRLEATLREPTLSEAQEAHLRGLYAEATPIKVRQLSPKIGLTPAQIGASSVRLSRRCKRVMTLDELADTRKDNPAVRLLIKIVWEPKTNEAIHVLTSEGREAVRKVLGL